MAIRPDGRTSLKVGFLLQAAEVLLVAIRPDGRTSLKVPWRGRQPACTRVAIRPDGRTSLKEVVDDSLAQPLEWLSDLMVGLR